MKPARGLVDPNRFAEVAGGWPAAWKAPEEIKKLRTFSARLGHEQARKGFALSNRALAAYFIASEMVLAVLIGWRVAALRKRRQRRSGHAQSIWSDEVQSLAKLRRMTEP